MGTLTAAQDEISAFYVHKQTNISVTLRREAPNGNYTVTWKKDGQFIGTNTTSDTQYTVEDLEPGTTYEFTIQVEGSSSGRNLNASTLPNQVQNLTMIARSTSSVTLQWQAPNGSESGNYTYWVSWGTEDGLLGEEHTTEMEHTVTNLVPATLYNFTVRAERHSVNSSGQSIQEATVPNEVQNLTTIARSNSSITLQWRAPNGSESGNYTYWVSWGTEDGLLGEEHTTEMEHTVTNLVPATLYNFTVRAERHSVNSSGQSIQEATVPNEVQDLSMDARSNSSVTLQWEAPSGPQSPNYTYWVSWSTEDELLGEENTTEMEHTVANLAPATLYNFTVRAERHSVNSSGQSIQEATVPNEVQDLRMDARSTSSITLQWRGPSGPQPANYTYWVSWGTEDGLLGEEHTTEMEHTVTNLVPATLYNFTVRAERHSVSSSGQSIQEATVPNEVQDLSMDARSNSSVTLQWEAPSGPQSPNYTYWVSWSTEDELLGEENTTEMEHTVANLAPATLYNFTVRAERHSVNSSGQSIQEATVPNEVQNLRMIARSNSSVTLQWEAPSGPQPANYTYWVSWGTEDGLLGKEHTTEMEHTVANLVSATLYNFTVRAERHNVNSSGQSIQEATVPNEVQNLRMIARSNSSVTLQWEAPSGPQPANYTYWVSWGTEDGLLGEEHTTEMEHTVTNLVPATLYNFTVRAERHSVSSSGQSIQEATVPNEVQNLRMIARSNSSVTLQWEAPSGPQPANYTYWVSWGTEDGLLGEEHTTEMEHTVANLVSATLYNFTVRAERHNVNSSGQSIQEATVPNEVQDLRMDARSTSSITLQWRGPSGPQPANYTYWVSWGTEDGLLGEEHTTEMEHTVTNLVPATLYNFTVRAERHSVSSSGQSIQEATVPNEVQDLSMDARSNSSVTLQWEAPSGPQSPNYTYWVSWSTEDELLGEENTTEMEHTVANLAPATLYNFTVRAERHSVNSSGQSIQEATEPNEVRNLEVVGQTNNSIAFSWMAPEGSTNLMYNVSWFLSENHMRQNFTNGTNFTAEGLTPGTWYQFLVRSMTEDEAQSLERAINASTAPDPVTITSCTSVAAGYGVLLTLTCPVGNQESLEFEVGSHRGRLFGPCTSSISVRGLQPARTYIATVSSIWAGLSAVSAPVTCHTDSRGVIAGAIVGILLLILLVGLFIFFCRWRQRKSMQEKSQVPDVAFSFLGDILAENLEAYIMENQKDSNYGFTEEYQQLALEGTEQMQTAALALENKNKNRFSNVLPYDSSRVPLQPIPGDPSSDYINASFIPGLTDPREYIATQGPLPQTVGDFWRLVWDQQSCTIVMLTNCVESGRVKCEHYWPLDAKPCSHGNLRVTLTGEHVAEHWTIRDLQLFHVELKKGLSVRQFHYTVWPDHGVPQSPDPLLAFQALLREWLDQNVGGGLPIVHCSAGVGRTGTLIALDVLLRQLQKYQQVGVQSFVKKMRRSRPLMVQTEGQYIFLYKTLLRFLQLSEDSGDDDRDEEGALYENVEAIEAYEQEIGVR
ncbi:receptor-type tyrosine-protein phosphatase H [Notamacropus eugenii]|uniref:receptor-type tyrosine-protein phosphatase H n=1 Tax=Notamacropus eugenii TaxID=9315 RepID=UPI003B673317